MSLIADIHNDMEKGAVRLITEYRARLLCDAVRLCESTSDAEDLVSRTLVKVIGNIDTLKEDGSLYNWMKSIMVNLHRNDLAHPVARGTVPVNHETLVECAGADWGTDEEILRNSDGEAVRAALRNLDPEDREILILRYYEELSLKEIASFLNRPVGTIGRRIHVALKLLAGKLGAKMNKTRKPLAVILVAFVSLVSAAAVATLPAFEPLRETVAGWFGGDAAQTEDVFAPDDCELGRMVATLPTRSARGADLTNDAQCLAITSTDFKETKPQETQLQQLQKTQPQEEKQNMKFAQTFAAAALAATAAVVGVVEADGVTLSIDKVQQRYPWNGLVDIDYTIASDPAAPMGVDDNLEVLMVDKSVSPAVTNRAITFLQAPLPLTDGKHRITWDANADGVTNYTTRASFLVKISHYVPSYMVIDVSGGPDTNTYPVSFYNGEPLGGFNKDEYKGNKIVLRRIHPGSYVAGSPSSPAEENRDATREEQHRVALTKPFYIGIFEITQQQYLNVMGGVNPAQYQGDDWKFRPVEDIAYDTIRGTANRSNHQYDWPWTNEVSAASFMGRLRDKCKSLDPGTREYTVDVLGFDLPTEFQWEYACRAGTTGAFNAANTAAGQSAAMNLLGRYINNKADIHGNPDAHTIVGSYLPNTWGLYDMHGNVWELCLDWMQTNVEILLQRVDPVGPISSSSGIRVIRGGSWNSGVGSCRSANRHFKAPALSSSDTGFRVSRTQP